MLKMSNRYLKIKNKLLQKPNKSNNAKIQKLNVVDMPATSTIQQKLK